MIELDKNAPVSKQGSIEIDAPVGNVWNILANINRQRRVFPFLILQPKLKCRGRPGTHVNVSTRWGMTGPWGRSAGDEAAGVRIELKRGDGGYHGREGPNLDVPDPDEAGGLLVIDFGHEVGFSAHVAGVP